MQIINITPKTQQWLDWRSLGITASEIAVILNQNPYKTAYELFAERTGQVFPKDLSNNPNVVRGVRLEDQARQAYENKIGDILLPICAEETLDSIFRASFDGITEQGYPVEIKCPTEKVYQEILAQGENSAAFILYSYQVQYQMMIANAEKGFLVFFYQGQLKEFEIFKDENLWQTMRTAAVEFYLRIVDKQPPKMDLVKDALIVQDKDLLSICDEYANLENQINAIHAQADCLVERQKQLEQQIKVGMGENWKIQTPALSVTKYLRQGSIDYSKALNALGIKPEAVEPYRKKSVVSYRFTATADFVTAPSSFAEVVDQTIQINQTEQVQPLVLNW